MTAADEIQIHRGLSGVYFDRSETSFIDGRAGKLQYRGYSIDDLATHSTFEETAYLLLYGALPSRAQLDAFDAELKAARPIPGEILDVICLVQDAHPMDVLRTAVSALAAFDPDTADKSHEATLRKGLRLSAQAPTIVTAHEAIRAGREPAQPSATLSHAANFLYMLDGRGAERGRGIADGHRPHPPRRARLERLLVHRTRRRRHAGRPAQRRDGRDRGAVGAFARWSRRERHEDGAGHRGA